MSQTFSVNADVWQLIPDLEIGVITGHRQELTDKVPQSY